MQTTNHNTAVLHLNAAAIKARIPQSLPDAGPGRGIVVERMEPQELAGLPIRYQVTGTAIGEILLASTRKGICYAGFTNNNTDIALVDLGRRFPKAVFSEGTDVFQEEALQWFNRPGATGLPLHLHLKGTAFQLSIWEKLLRVPFGGLTTYSQLGGSTRMARAAGTAVGDNPVCFLVPCHRAVRSNGRFEDYFWGPERKRELLALEATQVTLS